MYERSLEIRKSVYGEHHPDVATSYNNIGLVYDSQGEYSRALEMYERSLEIIKSVYGDNHPKVAASYNNIGSVYDSQGEYSRALEMYELSFEIYEAVYGKNSTQALVLKEIIQEIKSAEKNDKR